MAWGKVLDHPRLAELGPEDLARLIDELRGKVRCYGYEASPPRPLVDVEESPPKLTPVLGSAL